MLHAARTGTRSAGRGEIFVGVVGLLEVVGLGVIKAVWVEGANSDDSIYPLSLPVRRFEHVAVCMRCLNEHSSCKEEAQV
jgi:hypothetical protein